MSTPKSTSMSTSTRRSQLRIARVDAGEINRALQTIGRRLDQVDAVGQNPDMKGHRIVNVSSAIKSTDAASYSQVEEVSANVTALEVSVDALRSDVDDLETAVETLGAAIDTLGSTVETLQTNVSTLQSNVSTLQSNVTTLQASVSGLESAVDALEAIQYDTIEMIIDGAGSVISTGSKGYKQAPFACTINSWVILGAESGSIVVDVKKASYSDFPTTSSIAGTEKPTLSSAQKNTDTDLTTWTTSITAGDILEFVVESASTVTRVILVLKITLN